ncbi:caspase family protein [Sulfurovum sp. bin170]|nr:caspase family protein [Sulfurovum sp. bin170]
MSNSQQIYPQLNLFITKNNEWIAWTKEGFYNASKGAEQYIGYHINRGANKEAEFMDVSRFRQQFYRPDLVTKAINGEDISSYAQGIDIDSILNSGLPPKVEILTTSHTIDGESAEIGVKVCDNGGGVENLNFYVDDKSIKYLSRTKAFREKKETIGACTVIEQRISVPSGRHTIAFDATNQKGDILSNKPTITIVNNKRVERKPNLHLLTLSINDYKDDSLDLKFPNNDADKLSSKLKSIGKSVFGTVNTYALKDKQVTKEQIDRKVKEIADRVKADDVFVLYISGHGITNDRDGDYYFIPYGCANDADVTKEAINQQIFKEIMSQIKAVKSVILLDTCQSGSMASKELVSTSVNRFGGNVGSAIIAGASSSQDAIDGYKQHGIFTYTILDAMGNKKVYDFEDRISITDIAKYVKVVLPRLAKEAFNHEQKPTIYLNGDTSFAIGGI